MREKKTILVVDDDVVYRHLLTSRLTKTGYEVLIANNGREALNWIHQSIQRPDLVILDLLMPQMSGVEVLEAVKALPFKLPVILISGAEWPIARQAMSHSAPDAYLTKPFVVQDLLDKIEGFLQPIPEIG
ncbi:response regulator [Larkinella rosea]|uniref:Response regulator n=1 Tax=Larkinella rosea TaxID=2025312 RepID=A0A3P1BPH9_9BACT|nr:response regulator [Larkinella rosea]RRB02746.1 response regulator [Larkinella rosea]